MLDRPRALSGTQQLLLVLLRTLIGWHFLYEGYFKLLYPAWTRAGVPLERFSSAGYLRNAGGPFGEVFHVLADPAWAPWVDRGVAFALLVAGLLLVLGLFTQLGCVLALGLLAAFYLSAIPLQGVPEPRSEGTYLIVNKNLIEAAAVCVVLVFRTGRIAGLDVLRRGVARAPVGAPEAVL
ncbi:MAG TPA: DoxX family membrane protein [Vicinamibacterales bacterium]|nr:DoxX family membrane protein [Vicinamibacterales bacterium]